MFLIFIILTIKLLTILFLFTFIFLLITQLIHYKLKWKHNLNFKYKKTISFVHPFCADCGGGEKVLWRMITSLISFHESPLPLKRPQEHQQLKINIISGKKDNIGDLIQKLKQRFGIDLNEINFNSEKDSNNKFNIQSRNNKLVFEVELISMKSGYMLRPQKFLTMCLQILGQIYFAFEIITKVYSDVYCDTTGLPFTYFILKYFGHAKVTSYTHYPFISYEMINQVQHNQPGVHSQGRLNKFPIFKKFKIYYYKLILKLYELMGNKCLSFAYVNSTWTYNHMKDLWKQLFKNEKLLILYPPCSISLYKEAAKNEQRKNIIVSFAQFRPEKRQDLQIEILLKLKEKLNNYPGLQDLELHIIGGVRNSDDQKILTHLKNYTNDLGVQEYVKFIPNASIEEILEEFSQAKIGIHTMVDEHFGITLIEMMAAGLIVVTHNSAGAKDDILVKDREGNKPGILCDSVNDYINIIEEILVRYDQMKAQYIISSRKKAEEFSDEEFEKKFISNLKDFLL